MADRSLTRSRLKPLKGESSSCPPKKKRKSDDAKSSKSKKDKSADDTADKTANKDKQSQPSAQAKDFQETVYEVRKTETFRIDMPGDEIQCDVWSMCVLDSGHILVADSSNPVLKQFDGESYDLKNTLRLCTTAHSVCKVNETEVVLCLSNNTLQFASVMDTLEPTRTLEIDHAYLGICVISNQIFVTGGENKMVYIHDMDGEIMKTINGNHIFSWNRFIVESDERDGFYVTDSNRGLTKMDRDGDIKWTSARNCLKGAYGICTEGDCNVFVSGFNSNNVLQISSSGKYIGEVVSLDTFDPRIKALSFDKKRSKLYVSGIQSNEIYVYRLN